MTPSSIIVKTAISFILLGLCIVSLGYFASGNDPYHAESGFVFGLSLALLIHIIDKTMKL